MTTTPKTADQIVLDYLTEGPLYRSREQLAEDEALIRDTIAKAREGYVPTPPYPRTVWGVQVGTWPPKTYQNEQAARWYLLHADKRDVKAYGVRLVTGVAYSVDWTVVESVGPFQ